MADFVALQQSAAMSFVEIAYRILKRFDDYYEKEYVPHIIRQIEAQLPSIAEKADQIESANTHDHLTLTFRKLLTQLEGLVVKLHPLKSDPSLALDKSLYYESNLPKIWKEIENYKSTVVFFTDVALPVPNAVKESESDTVIVPQSKRYYNYISSSLHYFVARKNVLDKINNHFTTIKARSRHTVVLLGINGCGKTELAIKYCQEGERVRRFSAIFWVDASSEITIIDSFINIAYILNCPRDTSHPSITLQNVQTVLKSRNDNYLLVFDNLNDLEDISVEKYFPNDIFGYFLITSRNPRSHRLGKTIRTDKMTEMQGLELLFRRQTSIDRNELNTIKSGKEIVSRVGCLPVAIDQISAYIYGHNFSIQQFTIYYNSYTGKVLMETPLSWSYKIADKPVSVYSIWKSFENSFVHLKNGSTLGSLLLGCLFLYNKCIFEGLFKEYYELQRLDWMKPFCTEGVWSSGRFRESLSQLANLNLVSINECTESGVFFSLHPLIQDCIKVTLTDDNLKQIWMGTIYVLGMYIAKGTNRLLWKTKQAIISHLKICFPDPNIINNPSLKEKQPLLNLAIYFALFYHDVEDFEKAEILYNRILLEREKELGKHDISTLEVVITLAVLYQDRGELYKAEASFIKVLSECMHTHGPDHWLTLLTTHHLGALYHDQRKFAKAENMYRRSLEGHEKSLGVYHYRTLKDVNSLGSLYFDQGLVLKAENMYNRAFEGKMKTIGKHHLSTLDTGHNLGLLYRTQNKYKESESMLKYALEGREKKLGPQHSKTLNTIVSLADLYFEEKEYDQAKTLYKKGLRGYINNGMESPLIVVIRDKLSIIYGNE